MMCSACFGSGTVTCPVCFGRKGRSSPDRDGGLTWFACVTCGGSGNARCKACAGSGQTFDAASASPPPMPPPPPAPQRTHRDIVARWKWHDEVIEFKKAEGGCVGKSIPHGTTYFAFYYHKTELVTIVDVVNANDLTVFYLRFDAGGALSGRCFSGGIPLGEVRWERL